MPSTGRFAAVCAVALALVASGCSKTEDLPPDRKLFGQPPVIEMAEAIVTTQTATCDFTQSMIDVFCAGGIPETSVIAPIVVSGEYSEVILKARVVDAESTPEQSDLLLVGASFAVPPNEKTFVQFDDGSTLKFEQSQANQNFALDCSSTSGTCLCQHAKYEVTSNDPIQGDHEFTRIFAFLNSNADAVFKDCLKRDYKRTIETADTGITIRFRFDAVDRQGNLDTWHEEPAATVPSSSLSTCEGDPCGCCMLYSANPQGEVDNGGCFDLPGMYSPSLPQGFCVFLRESFFP